MKQVILPTVLCIQVLFFTGCTTVISKKYQNIPVTSGPNGATVQTDTGDSITTPGSFNLLRNQDHTLIAEYPGYEPIRKEIKHNPEDWFWNELEPKKVHFKFMWVEPTTAEAAREADANTPGKVIVGYKVEKEEPGKFKKIPVYGDKPDEVPSAVHPSLEQDEFAAVREELHRHTWEIGPEVYYFRYIEPHVMEDNGLFYGAVASYTYRGWVPASLEQPLLEDKGLIRLEGRFASGQVDYDGALSNGTPYTMNDIDDSVFETRLLLGVEELDQDWLASLYTGFGYRYLNDDSSFDPAGYERESNYLYIPLGYRLDGSLQDGWSWGGGLEADFLLRGKQISHLSDVGLLNVENHQKKGYGLRASLRFQNRIGKGIFIIEPFIRHWDIDKSELSHFGSGLYGIEPENKTTEFGLQLVWKF